MSSTNGDTELRAIEQLISALEPLDQDACGRVISYVFNRLNLALPIPEATRPLQGGGVPEPPSPSLDERHSRDARPKLIDVRTFANEKGPKTQVEKTAVIAFYLSEVAPDNERTPEITTAELTKYQKLADLGAPTRPRQALFQARDAGYLDSAGRGKYRLNPIGYNFVAHNLPSAATASKPRKKPSKKRNRRKKRKKG